MRLTGNCIAPVPASGPAARSNVIQHDLTFDVHRGSIFAIMGGSGCGKSTFLKSMIGLLRPGAGHFLIGSRVSTTHSVAHRCRWGRPPHL